MTRTAVRSLIALFAAGLVVSACGSDDSGGEDAASVDPPVVFAAASLTKPLEELTEGSELSPRYSFDGSSGLVDQIVGGAPADVFASADTTNMDRAVAEGVVEGEPFKFATNTLILVTPPGNPAGITGLDASLDGAKLVVCAPEVPCGRASLALADSIGVTLSPVSEEGSVTDVLGKVTSGEADAGLVYVTDASSAGDAVESIEIPGSLDHANEYWLAAVVGGNADAAKAFIDLVMSTEGQALLATYGFGAP